MPMNPEARASAEELIESCETLLARMGDDIAEGDLIAAAVEALLLEAERAGLCPRIVIWRLRLRLAALLHPSGPTPPRRTVAHA